MRTKKIKPKLPLMRQQVEASAFAENRSIYALLMEQGTGKTAVEVFDSARRFAKKEIEALIVLAPNGVQTNWNIAELPKHWPDGLGYRAHEYSAAKTKKNAAAVDRILSTEGDRVLRVLLMNWEALATSSGLELAERFALSAGGKVKIVADESHRIKSMKSSTTKAALRLRKLASVASILSGTPILNSPWDAFAQFEFLRTGLLGTTSLSAFRARYAKLLPPTHGVLRHIADRLRPQLMKRFGNNEERVEEYLKKYHAQIPERDPETGLPIWRNLDHLSSVIAPHSYRVTKGECLDLPPKVYATRYFRMTPAQSVAYDRMLEEFRILLEKEEKEIPVHRLASITKLSQITSGFVLHPFAPEDATGDKVHNFFKKPLDNPKLAAFADEIETIVKENGEQAIVWARFSEEIRQIAAVLRDLEIPFREYHGATSKDDRSAGILDFQSGKARVFLSNQAAGGTGLTLTGEKTGSGISVIYYSNTYRYGDRAQSEDRAHRIGQEKSVRYLDLPAAGTVDEKVIASLRNKRDVAEIVTGDRKRVAAEILNFDRK